jgi:hypothetical protein
MIGKSGEATRSQMTVILTTSLSSFISLQPPTTAKPTGTPPPTPNVPTQVSILYFLYVLLLLKTLAADTEHLGMECYLLAAHFQPLYSPHLSLHSSLFSTASYHYEANRNSSSVLCSNSKYTLLSICLVVIEDIGRRHRESRNGLLLWQFCIRVVFRPPMTTVYIDIVLICRAVII